MKKLFTAVLLLQCWYVSAQSNLIKAEYFIDHDPGYGNGTALTVSGNPAIVNKQITNNLAPGEYTLFLRVKDDNDVWGFAESYSFTVTKEYTTVKPPPDPIVGFEYFIDSDPGAGSGTFVSLEENDTIIVSELLDAKQTIVGNHKIGIRPMSKSGVWGLREWLEFAVEKGPCDDFDVTLTDSLNNKCHGESLGSIDITVSGGSDEYLYTWSNSATTEDLSGLAAGIYTVTVQDDNLPCTGTLEVTISEPENIEIAYVTEDVIGGNDGSADITVTGGVAPYSFSWDNGSSDEDLNDMPAGDYTITVTDANQCAAVMIVTIGDIITGLNGTDGKRLFLYPNPVKSELILKFPEGNYTGGTLQLMDMNGRVMLQKRININSNREEQIDINNLRPGVYAVVINSAELKIVKRVSIVK